MGDKVVDTGNRAPSEIAVWQATCKDCQAEAAAAGRTKKGGKLGKNDPGFEYSGDWAGRTIERGGSRSDRCPRHRREHRGKIQFIAVPYIDLQVIGEVENREEPNGPLGGLGPLPVQHKEEIREANLEDLKLGMTDENILKILESLENKQVAIVEAGTGTGKSTFMPYRLINPPPSANLCVTDKGPIIVTEPRKKAATGIAHFVGERMCMGHDPKECKDHYGPGFPVGYQISGDQFHDNACNLIYVTDGTMINWVREDRLAKIGMVIVDEAHERSENIDIILAQLREQVRIHKHLKVIIASATIDTKFFTEYFGGKKRVTVHSFSAVKSFGYGVPFFIGKKLDEKILKNGWSIGGGKDRIEFEGWKEKGSEEDGEPNYNPRQEAKELSSLRCINPIPPDEWKKKMPDALARQIVAIVKGTKDGDILGFLPTKDSIMNAVGQIKNGISEACDVYPLLASMEQEIIDTALAAREPGAKRKIVVSSNLAETSMTVAGVRYIVDSGLICQEEWDSEIVKGTFPSKPHSQSGLRQRWGRVGRDASAVTRRAGSFPSILLISFWPYPKTRRRDRRRPTSRHSA